MRSALVLALFVSSLAVGAFSAEPAKPVASANLQLPPGVPDEYGGKNEIEITGLSVHSDGEFLTLDVRLKKKPTTIAGIVLKAYVDTDNNPATGFADKGKTRQGFEYETEVDLCIDDFHGGATCSGGEPKPKAYHALAQVNRYKKGTAGETEYVRQFWDAVQSPAPADSAVGKIAYADLGVKPGQVIRLSACSMASAFRDHTFFPDIVLKLK